MTTQGPTSPQPADSLDPHFDEAGTIDQDYHCFACGYNLRTLHLEATCPECGQGVAQTIEQRRRVGNNLLHLSVFSIWSRLGYAILGILLPIVCFGLTLAESPFHLDMYQDGQLQTYFQLLYGGVPSVAFWPLLLYAMFCMGAMLVRPLEAGRYPIVHLGIYSGAVLALQFLAIFCLTMGPDGSAIGAFVILLGCLVVFAVMHGLRVLLWRIRLRGQQAIKKWRTTYITLIVIGSVIFVGLSIISQGGVFVAVVFGGSVLLLILAPALTLLVYSMMALRIHETQFEPLRRRLVWPLLGGGWLVAWAGSWATAIHFAFDAYAKLPTDPPNCYIATAAARGHRRLVGSRPLPCGNGDIILVNRQLRLCKVAELALLATFPRLHRLLRAIYDILGPPIAKRIAHPLAADAAYLLIAPFAAVSYLLLRLIGCDVERAMNRVYPDGSSAGDTMSR